MNPDHTYHSFLMDHASGALVPGMAMLAHEHTRMSPSGLAVNTIWSMIGGLLFEDIDPAAEDSARQLRSNQVATKQDCDINVSRNFDAMTWKTGLSGVSYAPGSISGTKYMKLNAQAAAPAHKHSSLEATLVLAGQLTDRERLYATGEIAFGLPGERHKPAAVGDQPCICFVAWDPRPFWRLT